MNSCLLAAWLSIAAAQPSALSATYQDGLSGYAGTQDTHLDAAAAGASFGDDAIVVVDGPGGGSVPNTALLRFDDIFGSAAGQIPVASQIQSATLTLEVVQEGVVSSTGHRMLVGWDESSTWDGMLNGIAADDVEAQAAAEFPIGQVSPGPINLSVAASVQSWSFGAANWGWAIIAADNSDDGWWFASSEDATAARRPRLLVQYVLPLPGDFDGSGVVDTQDINPFILALTQPAAYVAQYGYDAGAYDLTGDGAITTEDINPFIAALAGGDAAIIPEPGSGSLLLAGALPWVRRRQSQK